MKTPSLHREMHVQLNILGNYDCSRTLKVCVLLLYHYHFGGDYGIVMFLTATAEPGTVGKHLRECHIANGLRSGIKP